MQATNTLQVPEVDSTSLLFLFSDVVSQPQARDLFLPLNAWLQACATILDKVAFLFYLFICCLLLCVCMYRHMFVWARTCVHVHVCVLYSFERVSY